MHMRLGGMFKEVGRTDTAFLLAIFLSGTALSRKCSCATFLDPRGGVAGFGRSWGAQYVLVPARLGANASAARGRHRHAVGRPVGPEHVTWA